MWGFSDVIAGSIFVVLTLVALFHLYWAAGGRWPGVDEKSLSRTVIGARGIAAMPPAWLTVVVAMLIFLAGLFPIAWTRGVPALVPPWLLTAGMAGLTLIFILRGVASYSHVFRKSNCEEPFATLDQRFYGPLCLVLGTGYLLLLVR